MCIKKIDELSKMHPPITRCTWSVPPFYPGRPLYNQLHALRYVRDKLRHGGFKVVEDHGTHMLLVKWDDVSAGTAPKKSKHKKKAGSSEKKAKTTTSLAEKAAMAERLTQTFKKLSTHKDTSAHGVQKQIQVLQ